MEVFKDANVMSNLNDKALLLTIKTSLTKKKIIELFLKQGIDITSLVNSYREEFFLGEIEYIELTEGILFIYKQEKDYFIAFKNDKIRSIKTEHKDEKYYYYEDDIGINNNIQQIKKFIDDLRDIKKAYTKLILYDQYDLYLYTFLIDESVYKVIIEDDKLALMLPDFRKDKDLCKDLSIVLKSTKEKIGRIGFNLGKDNFSYKGNVSYFIEAPYRHKGYATRALQMIKKLVKEYSDEVDKRLYVSTLKDNAFSQRVILKNNGKLFYEGEVPKGDKLRIQNKVDYVKIYIIDASSL